MRDDDFSAATIREIAQRSGYVCAYPDCFAPTYGPKIDGSGSVNIGQAAHICAASPNGPRYDENMTSAERHDAENGIWMCATHATLIDRDLNRFSANYLKDLKGEAEYRAMKMLGRPQGCAVGNLASVSPAARVGANYSVLVEDRPVPFTYIFNPDEDGMRMTWFVSAFVAQFSIQKRANLAHAVVEQLVVTVHQTEEIPSYRPLFAVFPAEVNLFYVEIDKNSGSIPLEFTPTRYYTTKTGEAAERHVYPSPLVLDDNLPTQIAMRFNAKSPAMYLISLDAVISSGDQRERMSVMPPQWTIFEKQEEYPE